MTIPIIEDDLVTLERIVSEHRGRADGSEAIARVRLLWEAVGNTPFYEPNRVLEDELAELRALYLLLRDERDAAVRVRDQFVMKADECLARALAAEQAAEQAHAALGEILDMAMTRRTAIHMDGTESWALPLAGEIAAIARAALDGEGK